MATGQFFDPKKGSKFDLYKKKPLDFYRCRVRKIHGYNMRYKKTLKITSDTNKNIVKFSGRYIDPKSY